MKLETEIVIEILEECRKLKTDPLPVFKAILIIFNSKYQSNPLKLNYEELFYLAEKREHPINKRKLEMIAKELRVPYVDLLQSIYSNYSSSPFETYRCLSKSQYVSR